jgi:hypothetical protein
LKDKAKVGDDVKAYRVCDGEISLVEEVTGQFLIKNSEAAHIDVEDNNEEGESQEDEGDDFKSSLKSRKAF